MILLILLQVSTCSTTPVKNEVNGPALSFPLFPDPLDQEGKPIPIQEGKNIIVPLWYWIKITEYVIEVEKTREIYNSWQEIYLKESK
jgi:hypothetical protein